MDCKKLNEKNFSKLFYNYLIMQYKIKFVLALFIVILSILSYTSIRWALADIFELQVRYQLGKAQTDHDTFDENQWQITQNLLENTLSLNSNFSGYDELAVFFNQVADSRSEQLPTKLGLQANQELALQLVQKALLKRPSWPYLWHDFFYSKIKLKQYDHQLTTVLEQCIKLGLWEYSLQYDIAFIGLDNWLSLTYESKLSILFVINHLLSTSSDVKSLYKDMQESDNVTDLCSVSKTNFNSSLKAISQFCSTVNKSS